MTYGEEPPKRIDNPRTILSAHELRQLDAVAQDLARDGPGLFTQLQRFGARSRAAAVFATVVFVLISVVAVGGAALVTPALGIMIFGPTVLIVGILVTRVFDGHRRPRRRS